MERTRLYYRALGYVSDYVWATFADVPFVRLQKPLAGAKIARHQTAAALLVALVVMSGVIGMIMAVPHPTWLNILGLLLPIPVALLAARLVYRRTTLPRV